MPDPQLPGTLPAVDDGPDLPLTSRAPVCLTGVPGMEMGCRCGNAPMPGGPVCGGRTGRWASRAEEIDALLTYAAEIHESAFRLATEFAHAGPGLARARRGAAMRLEQVAYALERLPDHIDTEQAAELLATEVDPGLAVHLLTSATAAAAQAARDTVEDPATTPEAVFHATRGVATGLLDTSTTDHAQQALLSTTLQDVAQRYSGG